MGLFTFSFQLVKKLTPETKCQKVPKELCAPKGCGYVQAPEECYDKKETVIQEVRRLLKMAYFCDGVRLA